MLKKSENGFRIIGQDTDCNLYLLEFKDKINGGHSGGGGKLRGKSGHCWWVSKEELDEYLGEAKS